MRMLQNTDLEDITGPLREKNYRLSESGGEYSWEGSSDELKESLIGMMAVNDLAESAFGGVTAQLEVFGRAGLAHLAGVSDMQRNGFLERPITKKDIENKEVRTIITRNTSP